MWSQSKTVKLWAPILEFVTKIGQSQLMRRQIANELNFWCKLDSKLLSCALDVMNQSLVNDVKMHYARYDNIYTASVCVSVCLSVCRCVGRCVGVGVGVGVW